MSRTVLAIGAWSKCEKLMVLACRNGWSILHTPRIDDIPTALTHTSVDLTLFSECLPSVQRRRALEVLWSHAQDMPVVALGSGRGQKAVLSALLGEEAGAIPETASRPAAAGEPVLPEDQDHAPTDFRWTMVTSTLRLLEPSAVQSPGIRHALDYIESHYAQPISLADVAGAAFYSRCHFCKVFKESLGMSFVNYLSRVRIRHALDLLAHSDLPITEIAFAVGFNDLSHFERVFRTIQRQSPTQYRHQRQAKHLLQKPQHPPCATIAPVASYS